MLSGGGGGGEGISPIAGPTSHLLLDLPLTPLQSSPQSLFFPCPPGAYWGFLGLGLLFELKQTVPRSLLCTDRCIL